MQEGAETCVGGWCGIGNSVGSRDEQVGWKVDPNGKAGWGIVSVAVPGNTEDPDKPDGGGVGTWFR